MKTLYAIKLSSGLPRQRTFRSSHTVLASGETEFRAKLRALQFVGETLKGGHVARAESARPLCATPDDIAIPGFF